MEVEILSQLNLQENSQIYLFNWKKMNKQNSAFPWFNQAQLQWLEQKTAHLQWAEKLNKQQELYRLALPKIQEKQYISQRQEAKNELFQKIEQIKDPAQKQQMMTKLRTEDLADFAKQMNPQLKYNAPTQDVFIGVLNEAKSRGIQPQIIENYLNGKDEDFLYMMGYKKPEAPQWGIKWLATRIAWDRWWAEWLNPIGKVTEIIDDVVQKIPTLSVDERDQFAREKLGWFGEGMGGFPTMMVNALPSLAKTVTGVSRAITNPIETTAGLGTLAFTKEGHNMLKDRYWTNIQKTATEDPIGLASDLLTLVAGGAGALSKGASMGAKGAQLANMGKTAGGLSKVSGNLGKFASTANAVADLGISVLQDGALSKISNAIAKSQWIAKWGLKYLQFTQAPLQASKEALADMGKYIDNKLIDEKTQKALENNPYIAKWWEKTKAYIDEVGLSPESKKEVNTNHIQELGNEILEMIKEKESSLKDSWDLYEKIKNENLSFENVVGDIKIRSYLEDLGIKIGDDGVFNFDNSTIVKDSDMKAIQRAYEWATRGEYDAQGGLNQRRKLDQLAYPDGAPSEGTKVIKGIRKLFDEMLKENIPWLKEADANYSSQIQALNEIKEGLVYKQGSNKGQIRDNFNQIINTLDWPNRAKMLERLEGLRPWLWDEIRAVHLMKNLADSYYKQPKARWITQMTTGVVGGAMAWGVAWALVGAGLQWLGEKFLKNLNQKRVQSMIDKLWDKQKQIISTIQKKQIWGEILNEKEKRFISNLKKEILDNQKNLPQEEGLSKLREWAETKYQLADRDMDKAYAEAVKSGDEARAKQLLKSYAESKGYMETDLKYRYAHHAPMAEIKKADFRNLEKLQELADESYDLNLYAMAYDISLAPQDYFSSNGARWYGYNNAEGMESFRAIKSALDDMKIQIEKYGEVKEVPEIKVYRAVPKELKEGMVQSNGQWVSPSRSYAEWYGESRFDWKYKILEENVPADQLWWDVNDINEWWFDSWETNLTKATKNSRKLLEITYDENGELIPLSKRFNSRNADARYQSLENPNQKHWVANPLEKEISAQRAIQLENIRNGKSVQELADYFHLDIQTVEKITTPEGLQAYGKYGDWIITLAEKIKEGTAPHELFHGVFDLVDRNRKESILKQIEKSKGLDNLNAEEYLADSFSEYFRTGKFDTKSFGKGLVGKMQQFFYEVKQFITRASKNKAHIKKLFDEILDGEIDREMLGEVLGNKKGTDTHRHQQSWPRLVSVPVKSSIPITPENASIFTSKLNNLSKVVKSWNFDAVDFLDGLKNNLNIDKKSWYLISQKGWLTATLRISDHYANARNNKIRWYVENNTSIVIKLWNGKFKAKNGVGLIEFVYDPKNLTPEKMQGIIKGVQDWIDTGNYTDKGYDHTHTSVRASLENGEVKYQRR